MRITLGRAVRAVIVFACCAFWAAQVLAQSASVSPEDEYKKKIKVTEDIQPLGENPFGENISLYNGSLSFTQTDVKLSGQGPDLLLSRTYKIPDLPFNQYYQDVLNSQLVDWTLNIPHIETLSGPSNWQGTTYGQWTFIDDSNRCSNFASPPDIVVPAKQGQEPIDWEPRKWWHGYQMVTADGASQDLLSRATANNQVPQDGASYPIVTLQHWAISCLSQTSNGQPGQGFLAVAPDGTRYWFDHLIYKTAPTMAHASLGALYRRIGLMMVSVVRDRFGNSLTYSYDANGNATQIEASDGRKLILSYETWQRPASSGFTDPPAYRLHSVTLQPDAGLPRTWFYAYSSDPNVPALSQVLQPDGSAWAFHLDTFRSPKFDTLVTYTTGCATLQANTGPTSSAWMTHPSGLTGTFTVQSTVRGRSYTPNTCVDMGTGVHEALTPDLYVVAAVTQKHFTGAGIDLTWNYSYSPANQSAIEDCSTGCVSNVWTVVTDPKGAAIRYNFSNRFDASESLLTKTEFFSGALGTNVLRTEDDQYALGGSWPWPSSLGSTTQVYLNEEQQSKLHPLQKRTITQDGEDTYTSEVTAFNEFAQEARVRRYSSIIGQAAIEEQTTYLNDLPHWMLGLPQQVDNLTTGETESINTYNLSNVTLQSRSRFGQLLMSYGYDAQGNLASFTDPNNHTTSLSNYKRGIPQTIGYPDGHGQSLVIDDFGQISSITDQAGNTTSYSYDSIGRITGITYPTGDEAAWASKTFSYALVPSAERGVGANHWRRISSQGNAQSVTYFDAMLRPVLSDTAISGNASVSTTRTDYDWKGQKTFVSYPGAGNPDLTALTAGTHSVYDALERLTDTQQDSELGTLTTHTAYLSGAREQVTDPKGNLTTTSYQVFDQPAYQSVIQVQAPGGITQTISRDIYGNPLAITQSGLYGTESDSVTKTLTYDSFHRLCRTTEPESGSEVTAYDLANNIAWTASGLAITGTACGQEQVADTAKTNRSYDAMNRLLTLAPPTGTQSTAYTYDPLGNVQTTTSGITTWTATRNKLAQLTAETMSVTGNGSNVIRYSHDANAHLASISYPDGLVVNYAPDALGRPTVAGSFASNVSYFPDGDVEHFTFGNGTDYLVQKNARNLLSNFSYAQGSTLNLSEDYLYDANGNITNINDLAGGPRTKSFGYDALNRLTSAQAAGLWGTETYNYDPLNNIRSRVSDGQTFTYNYDATNRLASITNGASTAFSFGYDNRGNVTSKNTTSLVFDEKNQLLQIPGLDSYAYDASGRRVLKTPVSGNPTYYFYTQDGQLLYQYEANTTKSTDYVFLGKKLIARNEGYATTVTGNIDGINIDGSGNATLSGWACSTGLAQSITVEVFAGGASGVGGVRVATGTANVTSEPAVQAACQVTTGSYRFSIPLTTAVRQQYGGLPIYMYGDSPVGNGNLVLGGSGTFQVPAALTAPAAPATATATVAGDLSSLTVTWSSVTGATGYKLQQKQNSNPWNQVQNSSATSYTLSNPVDAIYSYQVQACNASGCSALTPSNTVTVAHVPPTPASISTPTSSNGPVSVIWASAAYATSYTLEQSINGGAFAEIYSGAATSDSFSVGATASYTYRVKACNANGCGGYATSGAVAVTIPPASAPSLNVPASSNTGSYTVSWSGVSGATTYLLQEQTNGGAWGTVQNTSALSWPTSGRGNGTYGYRVQACNTGGCGPFSGAGSIVVSLVPVAPTGAHVEDYFPSSKLEGNKAVWNAVSGATYYEAKRNDTGASVYSGAATTFVIGTATIPNVPLYYQFSVRACNAVGCSAWAIGF
ncbi:MAG TPA: hypothetical protein VIM98_14135 [Dyella sp.]|uniref:hypothetical protein n=1 Tax=Dyella sp. TaxID=1869338 RepID=UPI002F92D07A